MHEGEAGPGLQSGDEVAIDPQADSGGVAYGFLIGIIADAEVVDGVGHQMGYVLVVDICGEAEGLVPEAYVPVDRAGGLIGGLSGKVGSERAVETAHFAIEVGLLIDSGGQTVEDVAAAVGLVVDRQAGREKELRTQVTTLRRGGIVLPAHTGKKTHQVVLAGEEVDLALEIGGASEGLDLVVGMAVELQLGVEDGGVVEPGDVVVGGEAVASTVDPFPFAHAVADLLQLGLDAEIPIAKGGIAHGPELGGIDAHVQVVAGMFEEGAHAAVETVGVARILAYADLIEPVLVLNVVELLLAVVLRRGCPAQLEVVGGVVVEGEGTEEGVVLVDLAAVEIDVELQRPRAGAAESGGSRGGDEAVGVAGPDGQKGEVEVVAQPVAKNALEVGI